MNKVQQCVYCEENNKNAEVCGRLLRAVPLRRGGRRALPRASPPQTNVGIANRSILKHPPKFTAPKAPRPAHREDATVEGGTRRDSGAAAFQGAPLPRTGARLSSQGESRGGGPRESSCLPLPRSRTPTQGRLLSGGALPSLPDLLSRRNRCGFSGRSRGGDSCSICAWDLVFHVTCT